MAQGWRGPDPEHPLPGEGAPAPGAALPDPQTLLSQVSDGLKVGGSRRGQAQGVGWQRAPATQESPWAARVRWQLARGEGMSCRLAGCCWPRPSAAPCVLQGQAGAASHPTASEEELSPLHPALDFPGLCHQGV